MTTDDTVLLRGTQAMADRVLADWSRYFYGYYITYWHPSRPMRVVLAVDGADTGQVRVSRSTVDGTVHQRDTYPTSAELAELIEAVAS